MSDQSHSNNPSERKQTTTRPGYSGTSPGTSATSGRPQTYGERHGDRPYGEEHRESWADRPESIHREGADWTHEAQARRERTYGGNRGRHATGNGSSRSIIATVRELAGDVGLLARQEAELARTEIGEKIEQAKRGATEMGLGAALAYAGFLFVMAAAVFGLNLALDRLWLSSLIVGGIVHVIGLALLASSRSNLKGSNLKPERSARSLREDAEMARNETTRRSHV